MLASSDLESPDRSYLRPQILLFIVVFYVECLVEERVDLFISTCVYCMCMCPYYHGQPSHTYHAS